MGMLVDGKWTTGGWPSDKKGRFVRQKSVFHHWIRKDGSTPFVPEQDRYHLYVSLACPWAHRTLILRKLRNLTDVISLSVVDPFMDDQGWHFSDGPGCIPDPLFGAQYLREIYLQARPDVTSRVTVPVLWDKQEKTIVNNESREIIRMFDVEFSELGNREVNFFPEKYQGLIDEKIDEIYQPINNGVYRTGFAKTQEAYDEAVQDLFEALDHLEGVLGKHPYLCGAVLTEADWCLFTTLIRFDLVYYFHFKCNIRRIMDYPRLWDYLQRLYRVPGVAETCNFTHIKNHYFQSHESVNPSRIVPRGPSITVENSGQDTAIFIGKYLSVFNREGWESIERTNCEGAVMVVGVTDEQKIVLVEQYRPPTGKSVIEFPAGLINDQPQHQGQNWEENARREFLEETGYTVDSLERLTQGPPSPGMSSETVAIYRARGLKKVGAGGGDETEAIIVHEVPLEEVEEWLKKNQAAGLLVDPKVYAGLYFLK